MKGCIRARSQMIKLTLPLPPSINHSHITTKSGQRVPSSITKKYMKNARQMIWLHIYENIIPLPLLPLFEFDAKVYIDLVIYFPDNKRRDTHNLLKILLDSLEGIIYKDDKMALPRIMDFIVDKKNPRVEIMIYPKDCLQENLPTAMDVLGILKD